MKFLKGLLVTFLILIIVGGVGYVGYSFLFMNHSGHNTSASPTKSATQDSANSSHASMNNSSSNNSSNPEVINQSGAILQNKEQLDKSIATLKEALRLATFDPYAGATNQGTHGQNNAAVNPQTQPQVGQNNANNGNVPAAGTQGNNTTINIYPQNGKTNNQANQTVPNTAMQNMGTSYDLNKMEQLHNGLYKMSYGMVLLDQLSNGLVSQAENSNANMGNPVVYYTNQYNLAIANKTKLTQALSNINDAANLININPYIGADGYVYDKDRMNQIHQSIFKLAEGVGSLNLISDSLTKQTVFLSNTVQNYVNNANTNNTSMSNMNMSSGLLEGLFDNISMGSIVNIILIIFVIGLILGIFGFVLSMFKPSNPKKEEADHVGNN